MLRHVPLFVLFVGLTAAIGCPDDSPSDGPTPGEGEGEGEGEEGEGEGEEGEGEGEGEDEEFEGPTEPIRTPDSSHPDNATRDSDCDGLSDLEEFADVWAGGLRTDPAKYDSDGDGIADGIEAGRTEQIDIECPTWWRDLDPATTTSPVSDDSDGDCITDGLEDANKNGRLDGAGDAAGETDPNSIDSDNDGLVDGDEAGEDADCNGRVDSGETDPRLKDTDGDGVNDGVEIDGGLDPLNPDSDGDGIPDGIDPDPSVADPDSDGDGVPDSRDTSPNDPDRDDDGLCDGPRTVADVCVAGEDMNLNGLLDPGETDPARADTDGDGLNDKEERDLGTNPRLRDSDADLISDFLEVRTTRTNPLRADTDGDGLNDGLEDRNFDGVLGAANRAGQETDPTVADSDGDGIPDGQEDRNKNGRVDVGETDPRVADADLGQDDDGDGLSNEQEAANGTNPARVDSDCDGTNDAVEVQRGTNPLVRDSDGDQLSDGLEMGTRCRVGATPPETDAQCAATCVADADPSTTTNPLSVDSDTDGIRDGIEDRNRNGRVDAGETDPNNADTDGDGVADGAEDSNQNGVVDAGELNPLDPDDVNETISSSCANPITPGLHSRVEADILLALSPDFAAANVRPIVRNGVTIGTTAYDATRRIFAFALRRAPAPTASAATQLSQIEAPLVASLALPITQTFTTWDGVEAARGSYNYTGAGQSPAQLQQVARAALGLATSDTSLTLDFPGATGETGTVKLGLVVLRRSANTSIIVGVATNLAQFNNATTGRDFRLEDVSGGTAQAQVGDAIGTQCEVRASAADTPVDFIWVLDNSGSMGDELNAVSQAVTDFSTAVSNTDIDARVAVVSTEFQYRSSGPNFATNDTILGTCNFSNGLGGTATGRACACAFTTAAEASQFASCVTSLRNNLNGSGAEGGYGAVQEFVADVLTQAASPARRKLRPAAEVVAIFITDAGEQSASTDTFRTPYIPTSAFNPGNRLQLVNNNETEATTLSVNHWADFFGNRAGGGWDPTRTNEPAMFVNGILCPLNFNAGVNGCAGEEDATGPGAPSFNSEGVGGRRFANARYHSVINTLGGIAGSIAGPDGQGFSGGNLTNISLTIDAILRSVVTATSPYELAKDPISSTIKVALETPTVGACNVADVPRVTSLSGNGFLYDAATNRIAFVGNCRPRNTGTDIALSYRTWIDLTADVDGNNDPCNCAAPEICVNGQCACPADCGVAGGLSAGQTCNTETCEVECLADCGGCAPGQVCDADSPSCGCACPADCNTGGALPAGFVCDPATCQPTCAPDGCQGARPGPNFVCGATCEWECPADCGGGLSDTQRCNTTTCEPECAPDCNAECGGLTTCNRATCACECRQTFTCAPGFAFDADSCACECDAAALGCPATHTPNLDTCRCDCAPNCGGACAANQICDAGTCGCRNIGG